MKQIGLFLFIITTCSSNLEAQTALYNSGNLQIHQEGQLGLHIDLINDGVLDDNLGLAGFYGDLPLTVSGAFAPTFYDLEVSNPDHVLLATGINVINSTNFIIGNFETARNATDNYLNFNSNAIATNSADVSKVNGYVAATGQQSFTFPVGDGVQLRPLVLNSNTINDFAKCAYFFEDPNSPSTFSPFNTGVKEAALGTVSTVEFWRLEGTVASTVQLSWNERSAIGQLTDDPSSVTVVGWSKATDQWESLSGAPAIGSTDQGFVTSRSFVPNDYEILTLASSFGETSDFISVDNFLVTANGDGNNDALVIPEMELSPNNSIQIFDRFGLKVFEMDNYTDEFRGVANTGTIIMGKEEGLPIGVYFFIVELKDLNLDFQGFLYLAR